MTLATNSISKEIVDKAIKKAIQNGWRCPFESFDLDGNSIWTHPSRDAEFRFSVEEIIFNHDFAKALWGEEPHEFDPMQVITNVPPFEWVFQLQCMVIADDPIKYLGEHLE